MKPGLKRQQSGVVLIVTLVILIVLTLLGTSSIQMTGVSQRVAQNSVDTSVALRSAEAAIQVAEAVIEGDTNLADYEANANGKYMAHVVGEEPRWEDNSNWDGVSSVTVDYSDGDQQPLYMIEFVKTVLNDDDRLNMDNVGGGAGADGTQVFRITALGTGKTASAKVLLQSTYGKKF
jgi:type IV pilus assembly protein PilX